ncbi:hypothetical protein NitYY0826_C1927 [Nitratiruptor sp. YY08-26]|uniref:DUF3187 family protein n=1 Tax=unclassified Nitratiruptor TaxID=2624044 RepID=UPI001915B20C|nr:MULTISPECIES: DUF3187 family protein [unclassified Nitratiruptor]BCD63037.1 hypothetical protein NitYY0813_C1925 [Nitratiruptor sp. YY08-13]BCD66972.1 hypothetical protein NitYY0826_C1927 [Nitratiruptor sp. YY08-26]
MKKFLVFLFVLPLFAFEPLFTTIEHPLRLAFYAPFAIDTSHTKMVTFGWYEANNYENEDIYLLDFEIATLQGVVRVPLSNNSSLRIIGGIHRVYGGFMDGALDWFHDATGLLNGAVHNLYGENEVYYHIGSQFRKDSSFTSLSNLQIEYKHSLAFHPFGTKSVIFGGWKIPLAKKKDGFGSAKADYMVGLALHKDNWLCNISCMRLGKVHLFEYGTSRKWLVSGYVGYAYKKWLFEWRTISSAFKSRYVSLDSWSNVVNVAYSLNKHIKIFFTENLAPFYGSADFTIGVTYRF